MEEYLRFYQYMSTCVIFFFSEIYGYKNPLPHNLYVLVQCLLLLLHIFISTYSSPCSHSSVLNLENLFSTINIYTYSSGSFFSSSSAFDYSQIYSQCFHYFL